MKGQQTRFWFAHAASTNGGKDVALAVSAFTEKSARLQVRKIVGPDFLIKQITPLMYAHAWVVNLGWRP